MKLLIQNHPHHEGGDSLQAIILQEGLGARGHQVDFSFQLKTSSEQYDAVLIVHSNMPFSSYYYDNCKRYHRPFVVKALWKDHHTLCNLPHVFPMLMDATAVTVESKGEAQQILAFAETKLRAEDRLHLKNKLHYVQPAVDPIFVNKTPLSVRNLVYMSGVYNKNKSHLALLNVCKKLNLPVVTSGGAMGKYAEPEYYSACCNFDYGEVRGWLSKEEVCEIYNKTKVYVCCSTRETSSTCVCEAIACGCLVVSTDAHTANTNFRSPGYWTYDPKKEDGLEEALRTAYYSSESQENSIWRASDLVDKYEEIFKDIYDKSSPGIVQRFV
jgi:glycosyltransferase involved in cell wall biosynthesis